jgi:hypothetical protein
MQDITIKIFESTDETGFFYDIYDTAHMDEDPDSIDGGFCESDNIQDALKMAYEQAKIIIKNYKKYDTEKTNTN